jgi:hypothetical protein
MWSSNDTCASAWILGRCFPGFKSVGVIQGDQPEDSLVCFEGLSDAREFYPAGTFSSRKFCDSHCGPKRNRPIRFRSEAPDCTIILGPTFVAPFLQKAAPPFGAGCLLSRDTGPVASAKGKQSSDRTPERCPQRSFAMLRQESVPHLRNHPHRMER